MGVSLQIEGMNYAGWHAVSVQRGLEQAAGTFSASVSERWGGRTERWVIRPGSRCAVLLDGEMVLTGYVDSYGPSFDAGSHSVEISGRSATADLVDCAAIVSGGQFKQLTLLEIAERLLAPFGLSVELTDVIDLVLGPLADVQIQQGETCHAVIERLCRLQGLLVCDGPGGTLRLTRAGRRRAQGALVQGENILSASATLDVSERHSEYTVKGQRANTDDRIESDPEFVGPPEPSGARMAPRLVAPASGAGATVRACVGIAADAGIGRYRPFLVTAETQADDAACGRRAEWEARRRAGLSVRASVTVAGWRQGGDRGPLWDTNLLVPVVSPWLGIDRTLLISSVEFRKDEGGSTTALELTLPDAFAGESEAGSASGEDAGANADLWAGGFVSLVQRGLGALGL
jgi:prophage tail gpP-like protein